MGNGAVVGIDSRRASFSASSRTWMCAVDGSSGAHESFQTMVALRKSTDHIVIFHAYNENTGQQASVLGMTPEHVAIRNKYENDLTNVLGLPPDMFTLVWEDRRGRNLRETLLDLLFEYDDAEDPSKASLRRRPDFIVFGYNGHNLATSATEAKAIGSVADLAMRSVKMPIIMVKKPCPIGPKSYVMAVTASDLSKRGFAILLSLVSPEDKLVCLQVLRSKVQEDGSVVVADQVANEYYEKVLHESHVKDTQFITLTTDVSTKPVAEVIIDHVNTNPPTFLALAPRSSREISSITELIIKRVHCSIILCKHHE